MARRCPGRGLRAGRRGGEGTGLGRARARWPAASRQLRPRVEVPTAAAYRKSGVRDSAHSGPRVRATATIGCCASAPRPAGCAGRASAPGVSRGNLAVRPSFPGHDRPRAKRLVPVFCGAPVIDSYLTCRAWWHPAAAAPPGTAALPPAGSGPARWAARGHLAARLSLPSRDLGQSRWSRQCRPTVKTYLPLVPGSLGLDGRRRHPHHPPEPRPRTRSAHRSVGAPCCRWPPVTRTRSPVSSSVSCTAASSGDSPGSIFPPGNVHGGFPSRRLPTSTPRRRWRPQGPLHLGSQGDQGSSSRTWRTSPRRYSHRVSHRSVHRISGYGPVMSPAATSSLSKRIPPSHGVKIPDMAASAASSYLAKPPGPRRHGRRGKEVRRDALETRYACGPMAWESGSCRRSWTAPRSW